jgi:hypothetical protein
LLILEPAGGKSDFVEIDFLLPFLLFLLLIRFLHVLVLVDDDVLLALSLAGDGIDLRLVGFGREAYDSFELFGVDSS